MSGDHIRNLARSVAYRLTTDDPEENARDLEMAGWIAQLEGLDVYSAMLNAACHWRWEIRYRTGLNFEAMRVIESRPDFTPLASLDPSVEQQVLGCELMRLLETRLERRGSGNGSKRLRLLAAMILNGNTKVSSEDCRRFGLSMIANSQRKKKIRQTLQEILAT